MASGDTPMVDAADVSNPSLGPCFICGQLWHPSLFDDTDTIKIYSCLYFGSCQPPFDQPQTKFYILPLCTKPTCPTSLKANFLPVPLGWDRDRMFAAAASLFLTTDQIRSARLIASTDRAWLTFAKGSPGGLTAPPTAADVWKLGPCLGIGGMFSLEGIGIVSQDELDQMDDVFTATATPLASTADASPISESQNTAQIVIVYRTHDPFKVTLMKDTDLIYRDAWNLLYYNPELMQGGIFGTKSSKNIYKIGEFALGYLHLITQLRCRQNEQAISMDLQISFLPAHLLESKLAEIITPMTSSSTSSSSSLSSTPSFRKLGLRTVDQELGAKSRSVSNIFVRFCTSIDDLLSDAPVRVMYLPSVMWFIRLASHESLSKAIPKVLLWMSKDHTTPPAVFPPLSWEDRTEHKQLIYQQFNKLMLPTRWVSLSIGQSLRDAVATVAVELLREQPDGKFCVKGSWSCDGDSVATIDIVNGKCYAMISVITTMVKDLHQTHFGIQEYKTDLRTNEIRQYFIGVMDLAAGKRRFFPGAAFAVRTSLAESGGIDSALSGPYHSDTIAIVALTEVLMKNPEHINFFDELAATGLPMLRVDCGYDFTTKKAFLNEFAQAPDASTFTSTHGQDAIWYCALQFATLIAALIREY